MLDRTDELSQQRNDAIHGPVALYTDQDGTKLMTEYIFGNRARSNLKIRAVRMNLAGMRKRGLCYLGSRFAARVVYAMQILDGLNNLSYLIAVNSREALGGSSRRMSVSAMSNWSDEGTDDPIPTALQVPRLCLSQPWERVRRMGCPILSLRSPAQTGVTLKG